MKNVFKSLMVISLISCLGGCTQRGSVIKKEKTHTQISIKNKNPSQEQSNSQELNQGDHLPPTAEIKSRQTEEATQSKKILLTKHNFLQTCTQEDLSYRNIYKDRLPYEHARIDVFTQDSRLHQNSQSDGVIQEFMALSIDGYTRLIGRISSGSPQYELTPSRRWGIFGFWKKKFQLVQENGEVKKKSPMPWSIMLMTHTENLENCLYKKYCIHGTSDYGHASYGYQASKGCIRCATVPDENLSHWSKAGLHQELWKLINPIGANNIALNNNSGPIQWARRYDGWEPSSQEDKLLLTEFNKKVKIYTHNARSLRKDPNLKRSFEYLYPEALIRESIGNRKFEVENHFRSHPMNDRSQQNLKVLCYLHRLEDWLEDNRN